MDLRRQNRPNSRQYMQPSPVTTQNPQLFEDTSTQNVPLYPQLPEQTHSTPVSGKGWESYDLGLSDYSTPQNLPPYDPFGQQQQQQAPPQHQGFNNNPYGPPMHQSGPGPVGPGGPQQQYFNPQQFLNDPMASMAMQYGQNWAGQGRDIVNERLERYISVSKLKYYFAVDTSYVSKKLFILMFPFAHSDWAPKYDHQEPVPPRYDINAPDLYIPSMAFVSYILLSAYMMGLEDQFSPEVLGMQASSSLGAMAVETIILLTALYLMNINTYLKLYDLMSFCGYKFVHMIVSLLVSLPLGYTGYFGAMIYCSAALGFFLLRTLRMAFLSNPGTGHFGEGSRRSLYLLLGMCFFQPLVIWFMTHSLVLTVKATTDTTTSP